MSKIQIKNPDGEVIVSIDMRSGDVTVKDNCDFFCAAHAFWGAVSVMSEYYYEQRKVDPAAVIFKYGTKEGDVSVQPGENADVNIILPSTVVLEAGGGVTVTPNGHKSK